MNKIITGAQQIILTGDLLFSFDIFCFDFQA